MNLLEATMKALQGKLEEKPNKDNAKINAKLLNPRANEKELRKKGYSITGDAGITSVKRADRKDDFREIDVFDDGTVMTVSDEKINDEPIKNKEAFDAKSFLDTKREKPYEAPNKVSKFKMNKDTIEQADMEIADAEIQKAQNPEDAEILDKNVIEPWKKLKTKAGKENAKMLGRKYTEKKSLHEGEAHIRTNEERINDTLNDTDFMNALGVTPEDVIKQVKISKEQFDEISDYVANYKGTFKELYDELGGWNLEYEDNSKSENYFDCYYKSLLITVHIKNNKMYVQPTDVYVYASDISAEDMDEMFELDFDKPIDYSKLKTSKIESLNEEDLTKKAYYFEVGVEDNEGLDRKVPYFGIPYKTMDENLGMCKTFDEAFDYVENYVKNGVNKTYGIIVEVDVSEENYNSIYAGWSDAYDYYNMSTGKFRYSAYKDDKGQYVVAYDDTNDIPLSEAKECLKEKTLTWEDIMDNAEGTTFGQQALKVKDTARDNVEKLLVKAGIDIDNVESVEDEIEKYCKDNNIKFDTHGNLITECEKVTEDVDVDLGEDFYEKICRAYVDTANLEWVTTNPENNNSIVHGYFVDDNQANEYKNKVTPDNFKDIIAGDGTAETIEGNDYYEYDTWEDFYEEYVKDEIAYDINDIGVYSDGSTDGDTWDFYISEEDLTKLGLWNEDMKSEFLGENKKVTEDYSGNALDRTIVIENIYGNTLMSFKVSPDGKLYEMENCEIADEENAYIRIQQEEDWGEHTDLEDMYNDHRK